ncbi:MAG: hypothetical protein HY902_00975 [Deltaproteobacteria bacterium]|nr:hypothetical protein [Deltaproteobacteria bacterium]
MKKFAMFLALGLVLVGAGLALQATDSRADAAPCVRTKFDTKLTEDACKKGGQEEAKKVWKAWVAEAKKTDATMACKTCHTNMAPKFDLTPDGLDKYKKAGGK